MLHTLQQSSLLMLRAVITVLLLGCLVLNCLQMSSLLPEDGLAASIMSDTHGVHSMIDMVEMDKSHGGLLMGHECCEPDSTQCPLEIPLAKLFSGTDLPQFFQLFWLFPLVTGLFVFSLLCQRLYRAFLPVWRKCLPSYPRLHLQHEVLLN